MEKVSDMSKMTLVISPRMHHILKEMALRRKIPVVQVLRRAVVLLKFLSDWDKDPNHEIIIRDPKTGAERRLVMEVSS